MIEDLTPTESKVLYMLSRGTLYLQIVERLEITQENLHTVCFHIRQKTGIVNTKDPQECKAFITGHKEELWDQIPHKPFPTLGQVEIMRLLAKGKSYPEIALSLQIGIQSAQNMASQGCKRAGIVGRGYMRLRAIQKWVEERDREEAGLTDPLENY